jgi:serine/threonine protein kinase/Tol biopolymer transport system component
MTPERHQQIGQLYHAALELEPGQRAAFLDEACAGDTTLRRRVEALLAAHEQADDFLESPALNAAAELLAARQTGAVERQIGHYQILSLLGRGGMGEVYLAQDSRLGRKVALKLLPASFTQDAERVRRFEQEAKSASALNHPNIITIYEVGQVEAAHFMVTEYIDGQTLRQRMQSAMKLRKVLDIAIQVASALSAAHAAGIVHRDIKPENIMLRRDGYVKVLDFGLAKLTEKRRAGQAADTEASTREGIDTAPGVVMGTVTYMSPEQARGEEVDARSDIFSLGTVLYEMVAGRRPFEGGTGGEVISAILNQEPLPLLRYSREATAELERIVSKALRKDREERYQVVKDLLLDLKSLKEEMEFQAKLTRAAQPDSSGEAGVTTSGRQPEVTGSKQTAQTGGRAQSTSSAEYLISGIKQHKRGVALGLGALLLIASGIAFGLYYFIGQRQTTPLAPLQTMKMTRLTNTGKITTAAVSPDGKYVAYALRDGGEQSLWLRQITPSSNVQIVAPAEVDYTGLTFSRDGDYLYYVKGAALYQMPVLGSDARKLIADVGGPVTFSPNGQQLAFARYDPSQGEAALMRANADGSGEQKLAVRHRPYWIIEESPAWSPDGEIVTFSTINVDASGQYNSVVAVRAADGKETTITTQRWRHIPSLAWLPDGSGLVMIARDRASAPGSPYQIWQLSYPDGEAHRITNDFYSYRSVSLTADSRTLITVQEEALTNLWVTRPGESDRARQITSKLGRSYSTDGGDMDWTPDGKIVYQSRASGNSNIWMTEPDGSHQKQLTLAPNSDECPSSSPDGRYIVFDSFRAGPPNIWRMDLDGSNPRRLTSSSWDQWPDCSPDGKWVVYSSNSSGKTTLWKVAIEGGTPVQITNKYSDYPAISPDGKLIACHYKPDQTDSPATIAVIPFEGGEPVKVLSIPLSPVRWTSDGSALTYIDTRKGISNLWSQPLAGGRPKQLTNFQAETIFDFAWSRDGKQLALARGVINNDVVLISNFR